MGRGMIDYQKALSESEQAYRKAAIYETFLELRLHIILTKSLTADEIATRLALNYDALNRFLHAAAYLGLLEKFSDRFLLTKEIPFYCEESSIALFWILNSKVADILKLRSKPLDRLVKALPGDDSVLNNSMIASCVRHNLIIQGENGNYSIPNSTKKYLLPDSSEYIGHQIKFFEKVVFPMFNLKGLMGALKTGRSQWFTIYGNKITNPFELYRDDPILLETFTNGMHQLNAKDNREIVNNLNLEDIKTVLDVGGGSGSFALQLLERFKSIEQVDIYEVPDAIPLMEKTFQKYASQESKVHFIPGSFLERTTKGNLAGLKIHQQYDLIVLGWILHDWSDETNIEILKRLSTHLKPNKKLIILEAILPENKISEICQADMTMLLQTEGRERTFSEYQKLLLISGFKDITFVKTETKRQAIIAHHLSSS
jgi:acetylserotonin O-methyltransferase